jgi:adenylate cyclase
MTLKYKLPSFGLKIMNRTVLPERLKKAIRDQENGREILISILQLSMVIIYGAFYLVGPLSFSAENTFSLLSWVLASYMFFSLLRLNLAIRRKLPYWVRYLSIVIDLILLMSLIWSFHLQYQEPVSFFLKAHTLLYVFIFISIRALHIDLRYVIVTGVSASIGWAFMVLHILSSGSNDQIAEGNVIGEIASNRILIDAEFDKIILILIATCLLALAIHLVRKLLIKSVKDSIAAQDLSRFVPEAVMHKLINSERGSLTGNGELSEATILFTDIEDFTSIGEKLPPEQLLEALNDYFSLIAQPIEKYGGVICQFQGDAVLASFNAPIPDDHHASNAVKAALEIQTMLEGELFGAGISFNTRIGINSGDVVSGLVGSGSRVGFTVHGDDVNLSARLEQLNKEYGTRIIVSEKTVLLISESDQYVFRELGNVRVRGRQQDIGIYTLVTT